MEVESVRGGLRRTRHARCLAWRGGAARREVWKKEDENKRLCEIKEEVGRLSQRCLSPRCRAAGSPDMSADVHHVYRYNYSLALLFHAPSLACPPSEALRSRPLPLSAPCFEPLWACVDDVHCSGLLLALAFGTYWDLQEHLTFPSTLRRT